MQHSELELLSVESTQIKYEAAAVTVWESEAFGRWVQSLTAPIKTLLSQLFAVLGDRIVTFADPLRSSELSLCSTQVVASYIVCMWFSPLCSVLAKLCLCQQARSGIRDSALFQPRPSSAGLRHHALLTLPAASLFNSLRSCDSAPFSLHLLPPCQLRSLPLTALHVSIAEARLDRFSHV